MPTRKPSTPEGRKLRNKVNSKDVKLRKNKIVEKTRTGKKKTIQRAGKPVKTVEVKKTTSRGKKGDTKKGAKIGSAIGGAVGGTIGAGISSSMTKKGYRSGGEPLYKSGTLRTNAKGTLPNSYTPGGHGGKTFVTSNARYKGSKNNERRGYAAASGGYGAIVGSTVGNLIGQGVAKRTSKKTTKTKTVNGVNKTAQRAKVKAQTKTMRAKKRGSKR